MIVGGLVNICLRFLIEIHFIMYLLSTSLCFSLPSHLTWAQENSGSVPMDSWTGWVDEGQTGRII